MSASDRFLATFEAMRKEFMTIRDRPIDTTNMEDYQRIDTHFTAMMNDPELGDGEVIIQACEERARQMKMEYSELEMELDSLERQLAEDEEELARRMSEDYVEEIEDVSEEMIRVQDKRLYQSYSNQLADLAGGLTVAKSVFEGVLSRSVADIREERVPSVDVKFAEPIHWEARREQLTHLMDEVLSKASQLNLSPPAKEEALLIQVDELAAEARRHLAAGAAERRRRDEQLATFYGECEKLTLWCRQQLANLEAMQEPDHIQEYCRTLADNYATMSVNFAVLVSSVQTYVRDNHTPVRQALLEVDQVWFYVMVTAFERLSRTLFEIHAKSRLEDEVEKYAPFPKHLVELLKALRQFLQQETERSDEAEAVLKECGSLCDNVVVEHKAAASVKRLKAFAVRARTAREAYQCFREAILSRLTFSSTPADVVLDSRRRQMEFEECTKELKAWATAQAHGESWRDIYSKIVEIKRVIQREQEYVDERAGAPVS